MSLWGQIQQLPEEALKQVYNVYGEHFPIEVRCVLAQWIEDKPWDQLDGDNPQHEAYIKELVISLIKEIEAKVNTEENFLIRSKLVQAVQSFQHYFNDPYLFINTVKQCLNSDIKVIQKYSNVS